MSEVTEASLAQARPHDRSALLRLWAVRVVIPLSLAVTLAFCLLAYAASLALPGDDAALFPILWRIAVLLLLALAVVAAIGWSIAVRASRPVMALTDAIEGLGRGEQVRMQVEEDALLGRLQRGVNDASQALADARNRMQSELGRTAIELADKNTRLEAASQSRARPATTCASRCTRSRCFLLHCAPARPTRTS